MSRRSRTKLKRFHQHFGLGTHHHNEYASSSSYFPKSYSILGKQIRFPNMAISFLSQGKLTFYGTLQKFIEKIIMLKQQQINSIHTVNIGIKGGIVQQFSQVNNCLFAFSMILCCVSEIFKIEYYRQCFFTKYQSKIQMYQKVVNILQKMPKLQYLMFTFQDNKINQQKLKYLDQQFQKINLKKLTLRNLCYYIRPDKKINFKQKQTQQFQSIRKSKTQFNFVWQKISMKYNSKQMQQQQRQSLTASLCDQI